MTHFDIALAPAGKSDFFRGKSDLRWLEAAALGMPVHRRSGRVPRDRARRDRLPRPTPAEAAEILLELVDDAGLRERVGAAAHAHVVEHRTVQVAAASWVEVLLEVAAAAPIAA